MRPISVILPALLLAPLITGCPVVVGAGMVYGVVQWQNNEASVVLQEELEEVWEVTLASLAKLQHEVIEERLNGTDGRLQGNDFSVDLRRYPEHTTRITARVGTFDTEGNRRDAEAILDEILTHF